MSTERHKTSHAAEQTPRHDEVSFETRDVKSSNIYVYLIVLAAAVVASYIACIFILRITTNLAAESDTPPPPVRLEMGKDFRRLPPEPRLQGVPGHLTDPQEDWRTMVDADTKANNKLGWIDENAGIAQIPVKDAMKIIAEKGLPTVPASLAEKKN